MRSAVVRTGSIPGDAWADGRGLLLACASAWLVACGGGDGASDAQPLAQGGRGPGDGLPLVAPAASGAAPVAASRRSALAAGDAAAVPAIARNLFDFGEQAYPDLFPGHEADRLAGVLAYRRYANGAYLLVDTTTAEVYVLGGPFGPAWLGVGNAREHLPAPTLTVETTGSGSGTVGSQPAGITCGQGQTCSHGGFGWDSVVKLTATAGASAVVGGWSGDCVVSGNSCSVTLDESQRVSVSFEVPLLSVSVSGGGTVLAASVGIVCGTRCTSRVAAGTAVTLTASASPGWVLEAWSGACSGTASSCSVLMNQAERPVVATFKTGG